MYWNAFLADAAAPVAPAAQSATTVASASTPAANQAPPPSLFQSPIILFALVGLMMYFMLFRPQQQRAKQQAKLLAALKSGDKVATSSGIVGIVITVKDKTVSLRSADAKMEVTKSSVTEILESGDAAPSNT
jgi:preprotein translocase subunit YajC